MSFWERFYPDEYIDSAYSIDYRRLKDEGYKGIIYDIDNTLVEHGMPATERSVELFKRLAALGFKCIVLSNNKEPRVKSFAEANGSGLQYIYKADKPLKKGYIKAMELLGTDIDNTVFIGDQIFTDVWGAKRLGIHCILTKPINPQEEIQIVLKRYLEKPIIRAYERDVNR